MHEMPSSSSEPPKKLKPLIPQGPASEPKPKRRFDPTKYKAASMEDVMAVNSGALKKDTEGEIEVSDADIIETTDVHAAQAPAHKEEPKVIYDGYRELDLGVVRKDRKEFKAQTFDDRVFAWADEVLLDEQGPVGRTLKGHGDLIAEIRRNLLPLAKTLRDNLKMRGLSSDEAARPYILELCRKEAAKVIAKNADKLL